MKDYSVGKFHDSLEIPPEVLILKGILSGFLIGLGASASVCAASAFQHGGSAIGAFVFPIGLILTVYCGGKLYTGEAFVNSLSMLFGLDVKGWKGYVRAALTFTLYLGLVFAGNWIGSFAAAFIAAHALPESALMYVQATVAVKSGYGLIHVAASAFLCNVFVGLAVYPKQYADDSLKMFITWFCVFCFVVCGFEHSVANIFYEWANYFTTGEFVDIRILFTALCNFIGAFSLALIVYATNKDE